MTQIKLRRDTSANFTSKNPVLGVGEPAYETDTKKLKIGDGTTAYTQLEYFSAGGGGSTNIGAALPLKIVDGVISLEVDGQTIQIVDGKLHANLDELGNKVNTLAGDVAGIQADLANKQDKSTAVTTNTTQTIAGIKTFSSTISGSVNGSAEFLTYLGNHEETASSSTPNDPTSGMAKASGLFLTGTYEDSATPTHYGNIINIAGGGSGQLLCEWSGTDNLTGCVYYRSHRDTNTGGWGAWQRLAFTTDNVASATKATQDGNGNNIVNTYATKTSLNTKADITSPQMLAPYLKSTYVNGASGYRIWSDGYCEQWGKFSYTARRQNESNITLTKIYKDINYNVFINPDSAVRNYEALVWMSAGTARIISSNNFYAGAYGVSDNDANTGFWWKTCGYLAEGEY